MGESLSSCLLRLFVSTLLRKIRLACLIVFSSSLVLWWWPDVILALQNKPQNNGRNQVRSGSWGGKLTCPPMGGLGNGHYTGYLQQVGSFVALLYAKCFSWSVCSSGNLNSSFKFSSKNLLPPPLQKNKVLYYIQVKFFMDVHIFHKKIFEVRYVDFRWNG